jgi:hypothetical protein
MSKRTKIAGLTFSIILHLFLLFLFLPLTPVNSSPDPALNVTKKESTPVEVKLIPMVKPPIASETKLSKKGKAISYPVDDKICDGKDKTYKGVGIIYNPGTNVITHAPKYYPGYIAGLREGDYILNPNSPTHDDYINFEILREREHLHFHIRMDTICFRQS